MDRFKEVSTMRQVAFLILMGIVAILLVVSNDMLSKPAENNGTSATVTAPAAGGTITGTVTYLGAAPPAKKLTVTKDVAVCGKTEHFDESLVVGPGKGIKYVVVSVLNVKGGKALDAMGPEFVLDQKGCAYLPHVLLVPVNKPLQILNNDGILHNIHSFSTKNTPFNKPQPKFQKKITQTFAAVENVEVKCDVHAWMGARVVVVDHPYHAVTDANGKFTITDVPPGTYTVEFWQEALGKQTAQVTVAAGATATLDFKYPTKQ
jgi:hypothetical protein